MRNAYSPAVWELDTYYTYDNASRIATYENPDQWTVLYSRDAAGQVTGIGEEGPGINVIRVTLEAVDFPAAAHIP